MADFTREEILAKVAAGERLEGDELRGAVLSGANLSGANLREARLWEAVLRKANLSGARYDANTKWPEGFDPVAKGAVMVEDDD